jgi:hypothetical protein
MAHNIDLPRHRYVWVIEAAVHRNGAKDRTLPALWWGMSATPGRMFGCHVLLESGAMVADLPLHALRHRVDATQVWYPEQAQRWDAYGWQLEAHEPSTLSGLSCRVLSEDHRQVEHTGDLWFYVDHVADGYSLAPAQHKHHWIVAVQDGVFTCVPQDMVLVTESSFTRFTGIPPVKRQTRAWSCEP